MGRLKSIILATTLWASSVSSHAGDVFENPEIPASEVCRTTALILDGKDLCEKPEKKVAKKPEISWTSFSLALLLGWAGLVWARVTRRGGKKKLLTNNNRGLIPEDDLVVLTERIGEATVSTQQKKKEIENYFENKGVFEDQQFAYVLNFQTEPEKPDQDMNDRYQIGLIKETGAIFFHRIIPHFEWLDDSGKWHKSKENPGFIGLETLKGTLEIMKMYKREPLFSNT